MKTKKINYKFSFLAIVLSAFLFTGCIGVNGHFKNIRNNIISYTGNEFNKDVEFSIGSIGIGLSKMIVKASDEHEDAYEMLKEIDGIQIGVYKNVSSNIHPININFIKSFDKEMTDNGYTYIVKTVEEDQATAIYVENSPDNEINKLFIISFDRDELTLVELEGNINGLVAAAIKNKRLQIAGAF